MPNGFGDIVKKHQQRLTEAGQIMEVQQPKLQAVPGIPAWKKALYAIPGLTSWPIIEAISPVGALQRKVLERKGIPEEARKQITMPLTTAIEAIKPEEQIAQQHEVEVWEQAFGQAKVSEWFLTSYTATPEGLRSLGVSSGEEYIQKHGPGLPGVPINPDDLGELENYVDYVLGVKEAPTEGEAGAIETWLTKPMPTRPTFKGIHTTTVDEMVKYLRRETAAPKLPPGVSEQDLRNQLAESGLTPEEIAAGELAAEPFAQLINNYEESVAQMQEYKMGIATPEMPEETAGDKLKRAFVQPGLAMMDVIQPYLSYVIYPLASVVSQFTTQKLAFLQAPVWFKALVTPGTYEEAQAEEAAAIAKFDELTALAEANMEAGMDYWSAQGKAWIDWKVEGWQKLVLEIAIDPLNFIGWGWFIKANKVIHGLRRNPMFGARGIPVLNQMFSGAAAVERGFLYAGEGVFTLAKKATGWIKPTTQQTHWLTERQVHKNMNALIQQIGGDTIPHLPEERIAKIMSEAIEYRLIHPEDLGSLKTQLGDLLVQRDVFDRKKFLLWAKQVGSPLNEGTLTNEMLVNIESVLDKTRIRGGKKAIGQLPYTVDGAAQELARIFMVTSDGKVMKALRKLIKEAYDVGITRAKDWSKMPVLKAIREVSAHSADLVTSRAYEAIELNKYRAGMWRRALNNVEPFYVNVWRNWIDPHFVRPMARLYLITGSYAPWNWGEEVLRTMMGRGGFIYGKNMPYRARQLFTGLMLDPEIFKGAELAKMSYGDISKLLTKYQGVALGTGEISEAVIQEMVMAQGKEWVEKALLFGWLPKIGTRVQEALYFPIRASAWAGGMQRSGFVVNRYLTRLGEISPGTMKAIKNAITPPPRLPGISQKKIDAMIRLVEDASYNGPNAVRRVLDDFTELNIKTADVGDSLSRWMELHEVREYFLTRAQSGQLWHNIDDEITKAKSLITEKFMNAPEQKIARLRHIVDSMIEEPVVDFTHAVYGKGFTDLGPEGDVAARGLVKELADKLPPNIKSKVTGFNIDKVACDAKKAMAFHDELTGVVTFGSVEDMGAQTLHHEISHSWYQHMRTEAREEWLSLVVRDLVPEDEGLRVMMDADWSKFKSASNEYFANMMADYIGNIHYPFGVTSIHRRYSTAAYNKMKPFLEHHFPKKGLAIDSKERLMNLSTLLREVSEESPETISSLFAAAHDEIGRIPTLADREVAWAKAIDRIDPFLDTIDDETRRLRAYIDKYATDLLTPQELLAFNANLDVYAERVGGILATRKLANDKAKQLIGQRVKPGSERWRSEVGAIWEKHFTIDDPPRFVKMMKTAQIFDNTINPRTIPEPMIDASVKGLTKADVAALLWTNGDQLANALLNSSTLMRRSYFVALVADKADDMAVRAGKPNREALGFTDDAISKVYDDVLSDVNAIPAELHSELTVKYQQLDLFGQDLQTIRMDASFDVNSQAAVKEWIEGIATNLEQLDIYKKAPIAVKPHRVKKGEVPPEVPEVPYGAAEGSPDWWKTKQTAMDDVMKEYYTSFTDYTHANAFDDFMKQIYPYWTYESQRWLWLPKAFIQHPGMATAWGKWMNYSDFGYVHVPGTSLDINILRGTVFKGGATSLVRRDYPEYYDQVFPEFFAAQDYGQRWGFFPNAFWGLLTSEFGGRQRQTGQLLPSVVRTPLDLFVATNPDSEVGKALYDILFPDYFRDYMTVQLVSKNATKEQIESGINGVRIWEKLQRHDPLTDEEHKLWYDSVREVAMYGPLMQHSGTMRMRPEEKIRAYEWWGKFIEEKTGLSPEFQKRLREHGFTIGDVVSGMSELDLLQIREAEEYQRWLSPRLTATLRPSNEIEVNLIHSEFWGEVKRRDEEYSTPQLKMLEDRAFRGIGGWISKREYVDGMNKVLEDRSKDMHILHGDKFNASTGQWETDLNSTSKFRHVPITQEERSAFYNERGIMITMSAFDEMLNEWYQISVEEKIDRETNTPYLDFGTYFATQRAIDKMLQGHPELKADWDKYLQRNWTPGRALYKDSMENYIQPYRNVQDIVIKEFSLEEQSLIDEYYKIRNIDQARTEEIQDYVMPNGLKLISQYQSMVSNAKKKLRMVSPMTDAQLLFWNVTTTLLTPEAQTLYDQLVEQSKRLPAERI